MVARISTVAFQGIDVLPVGVQVQIASGLPAFTIRVLRVARTLADLDGAADVRRIHVAEALSYRRVVLAS